jgi:hypothetical protein
MRIDLRESRCRTCDSALDVIDILDSTMRVRCLECDDTYEIDTESFGDGGLTYFVPLLNGKPRKEGSP